MKTLTHAQYCKNKTIRASMGFTKGHYMYEGKLYTPEQIEDMFPLDLPLINVMDRSAMKGENVCKKVNFIHNQKSY